MSLHGITRSVRVHIAESKLVWDWGVVVVFESSYQYLC